MKTDSIEKILIIKVSALGDVVRTFPSIVFLREKFPAAHIAYMTAEEYAELLDPCPHVQEIIPYKKRKNTEDMAGFWGLDLSGGIIVNDIVANSPASKAGLAVGDIIAEVNGYAMEVDKDEKLSVFQRLIAELGPGASAELTVLRRSEDTFDTLSLSAMLEEAPLAAADAPAYEIKPLEFKVRDLVFADFMFYDLDPETFEGVVVSELKQGGLAFIGGLQPGDIIQRIDNHPVASVDDVKAVMDTIELAKPGEVIFFVWRDQKTLFVNVKTDWK